MRKTRAAPVFRRQSRLLTDRQAEPDGPSSFFEKRKPRRRDVFCKMSRRDRRLTGNAGKIGVFNRDLHRCSVFAVTARVCADFLREG